MFSMGTDHKPAEIAQNAIAYAEKNGHNVVILDTAGRLHVDEDMMAELQEIKETVTVHQTLLVVDAMTGQDAVMWQRNSMKGGRRRCDPVQNGRRYQRRCGTFHQSSHR